MSNLITTGLIGFALLGMGTAVHAQNDVDCNKCVDASDIAAQAINSSKIEKSAVTTKKIAKKAVTAHKIAAGAVTSGKIKNGAVGLAQIDTSEVAMQRHVMLCGTSSRDVTTFVPGYPAIDVISGCTPTPTTIAMLVSRDGAPQLDQSELQDFLNDGGGVVCEALGCAAVFNLAFNANVVDGNFNGDCYDSVQPEVQLNFGDNVWKNVDHVPPPENESGCGFDMQDYPGITAIGGWTVVNSVSLAYRDLGNGRLWLVEQDWKDSDASSNYRHSRTLMGYMLTHVR